MNDDKNKKFDVDSLLKNVFQPDQVKEQVSLKELFERRVEELKITPTEVLNILQIEYRSLYGIINGTQKRIDYVNLLKIAQFLQKQRSEIIHLYLDALDQNFNTDDSSPEKRTFIKENFDLGALKKAGFINSITNFDHIEEQIVKFFGLKSIFDYQKPPSDVAFSAGLTKPKNELTRSFWIKAANDSFIAINNPYEYSREALIKYFPQIRWHSTNVELGLRSVIRDLYKIGVTVIYQAPLPSLHLRGATFAVNDKPCVVLTNYVNFYPTLWFALVHELYHVLFDWEEIYTNSYHLSDADNDQLSVLEREKEADNFAREYLFSKDKTEKIRAFINDKEYVEEFAKMNHVHPSMIYVFNAFDVGARDRMAWAKARKNMPDVNLSISGLENSWGSYKPISDFIKQQKHKLFN